MSFNITIDNATGVKLLGHIRREMTLREKAAVMLLGKPPLGVAEKNVTITLPDGFASRTKLVWPTATSVSRDGKCPLVVLFHGGGLTFGTPEQLILPARAYALHFGAVVALPTYKLTPENKFPTPAHSAWELCAWLSDPANLNGGALAGTGAEVAPELGFVVGGVSAGGYFTVTLGGIQGAMHDEPELVEGRTQMKYPITGLFAAIPAILHEGMVPERFKQRFVSRQENATDSGQWSGLTTATIQGVEERHEADIHSPWYSPVNFDGKVPASFKEHHPAKVFIQACALDPLRDDAIIYEQWIRETNATDVRMVMVEGHNHNSWITADFPGSERKMIREVSLDGMGWLLSRGWDRARKDRY